MPTVNAGGAARAYLLACAAGAATGIGAAVVFSTRLVRRANRKFLAGSIALAAGVMLYVSMTTIFTSTTAAFTQSGLPPGTAYIYTTLSFFGGVALYEILDAVVGYLDYCDHGGAATMRDESQQSASVPSTASIEDRVLVRMSLMTALAIAISNFPEGMASFVGALVEPDLGASVAVAIGVHNIAEGICVAVPIYYATENRCKAFCWGVLSGASEPVGAALAWLILRDTFDEVVYSVLFGLVSGMMVCICLQELIPTAVRHDPYDGVTSKCLIAGMAIMALSLCLFNV
ncbi:heavy metal transporter putative zinc transporter [Tribonema minus]|uniref:Heavy metal transporter putative zinc transporter n=1 Tax=Tribonema minus TaxID=303371 RepID=A0A835YKN7_9STRA|nr:heavy metal transporter putative zinc transporter [Tribonema minus]